MLSLALQACMTSGDSASLQARAYGSRTATTQQGPPGSRSLAHAGSAPSLNVFLSPPQPTMLQTQSAPLRSATSASPPHDFKRRLSDPVSDRVHATPRLSSRSTPEFSHTFQSVSVVDYKIQEGPNPYAVFRLIVEGRSRTTEIYRRYSDFEELHRSLHKTFDPVLTDNLALPRKRIFKRRKFDVQDMQSRQLALDAYMKTIASIPALWVSVLVRDFLNDTAWKALEYVPVQACYVAPRPSDATPNALSQSVMAIPVAAPTSPILKPTFLPSPPSSGPSPLQPEQRRLRVRQFLEQTPPPRPPRSPLGRRRVLRKIPMPMFDIEELYIYGPVPVPQVLTLRREFDTERAYVPRGTPRRPESHFKKSREKDLPKPPAGFFDVVFPSEEHISKQRAFLREFYKRRFNMPSSHLVAVSPSPP